VPVSAAVVTSKSAPEAAFRRVSTTAVSIDVWTLIFVPVSVTSAISPVLGTMLIVFRDPTVVPFACTVTVPDPLPPVIDAHTPGDPLHEYTT